MKRLWPALVIVSLACLGLGFGVPKALVAKPQANGSKGLPAIIFVAAPKVVPGRLAGRFPGGSYLVRYAPGSATASAVNLTPKFFAVADPRVSPDATTVLFAGQKSHRDHWQIWAMKVNGSGLRQITHCPGNCFQPAYLPRHDIVYTVVTGKGVARSSAIYVSQSNGADAHPITFGPGNFQVETVLRSGRLLVSAKSSLVTGDKDSGSRVFYTLRPDGSDLNLLRWNHHPDSIRSGATELEDGTVLFVKRHDPAGRASGGELAWIRPGALHNSVITPAASTYWSAHVLDGDKLVVAKKGSGLSGGTGNFGIYVFHAASKSAGKEIYYSPEFSSVEAVPVEPHATPLYYPSVLHPHRDYGRIVCLNSYLSAGAPHGRLRGQIARVRVIALQSGRRKERVLGEAPVESDGSFYIKVPADLPIRFELLGKKGSVVRAQKSWIWARNGEDVACLGCHENEAMVPRDHFPLALKDLDAPFPIGLPAHAKTRKH